MIHTPNATTRATVSTRSTRLRACMRRRAPVLLALLLALVASCASTPPRGEPTSNATPLKVMSFNVRLPTDADGADRWEMRKGLAARVVRDAAPDLFGTQELFKAQGDYLTAQLPEYAWFGRGRDADGGGEHMGVFYRKDALRVLESGNFWLSDTPEVPGSITWGHPITRMATWALFERIADRRRFYLFNTHLPYREEDEDARTRGAELLRERIASLPADIPVVLTGDFNAAPESPTHAAITRDLRDAWDIASERNGPEATFHAFKGDADRRIDWILVRGFGVRTLRTIDAHEDGRYPSDHFPVLAELDWPPR